MSEKTGNHSFGLHVVALYEAVKGLLGLGAGVALLLFSPQALQDMTVQLMGLLHMNPDHRFPRFLLRGIEVVATQSPVVVVAVVGAYVFIRFAEAYGLWRDRAWAEWLAIVSGALYLPLEFYELFEGVSWPKALITAANLFLVVYLLWIRLQRSTPAG